MPEGTIDLEHFHLETYVLEPLENPFGTKVLPNVSGLDRRRVVRPERFKLPTFWFVVSRESQSQKSISFVGVAYGSVAATLPFSPVPDSVPKHLSASSRCNAIVVFSRDREAIQQAEFILERIDKKWPE